MQGAGYTDWDYQMPFLNRFHRNDVVSDQPTQVQKSEGMNQKSERKWATYYICPEAISCLVIHNVSPGGTKGIAIRKCAPGTPPQHLIGMNSGTS